MRKVLPFIALILLALSACKPSEKNYRIAYETAQQRAREGLDSGVYELMQQEELPPMIHVLGDSVRLQRLPLQWFYSPVAVDSGKPLQPAAYNVAVGKYRMPANARAQADNLAARGLRSAVFLSKNTHYYVMAGMYNDLDSAARLSSRLLREMPEQFVGMPCPVAIQPIH